MPNQVDESRLYQIAETLGISAETIPNHCKSEHIVDALSVFAENPMFSDLERLLKKYTKLSPSEVDARRKVQSIYLYSIVGLPALLTSILGLAYSFVTESIPKCNNECKECNQSNNNTEHNKCLEYNKCDECTISSGIFIPIIVSFATVSFVILLNNINIKSPIWIWLQDKACELVRKLENWMNNDPRSSEETQQLESDLCEAIRRERSSDNQQNIQISEEQDESTPLLRQNPVCYPYTKRQSSPNAHFFNLQPLQQENSSENQPGCSYSN